MNNSSQIFDSSLNQIEHYQRFPAMRPYIGAHYGKGAFPKILLIAESHYLPPLSTISKDPDKWYAASQADLSDEETAWINTRNIVGGKWKAAGHMIFRELNTRLAEFIGGEHRAMSHIAFMNAFQRPAPESGESMKKFSRSIDYQMGAKTVSEVLNTIEPDLVIFVSKFAWDKIGKRISKMNLGLKCNFVCHPGTGGRYWHNKNYPHGLAKFRSLLETV